MKTQILAALGEIGLRRASALNNGLAANDRIEYGFSLLQMALDHAQHPEQPVASLKRERLAAGIDDTDVDVAISGAREVGKDCRIPGAARILERIEDDMRLMAAPLLTPPLPAALPLAPDGSEFGNRLEILLGALPSIKDDLVDPQRCPP